MTDLDRLRAKLPGPYTTKALALKRERAHAKRREWMATPQAELDARYRREFVQALLVVILGIVVFVGASLTIRP